MSGHKLGVDSTDSDPFNELKSLGGKGVDNAPPTSSWVKTPKKTPTSFFIVSLVDQDMVESVLGVIRNRSTRRSWRGEGLV